MNNTCEYEPSLEGLAIALDSENQTKFLFVDHFYRLIEKSVRKERAFLRVHLEIQFVREK